MFSLRSSYALLLAFGLLACGVSVAVYQEIESKAYRGDFAGAVASLERNRKEYEGKSEVLYNLESGLLSHYAEDFERSNRHFFQAEKRMEELYTKSVSTEAAALLTNDNLLPYEGEDFEKVFVNLFLALNFAEMGNYEAALVEARKVDVKLNQYSRAYEGKNAYKEDAFIRYIIGLLYEAEGEINDAFIAYRKAFEAYREYERLFKTVAPSFLKNDLLRTADALRFTDEKEEFERLFGRRFIPLSQKQGSVVVIIHSGKGPIKEEISLQVSIPDTAGTVHTFKIALPKFKSRERSPRRYVVQATSTSPVEVPTEVAQDVTRIAEKALDDRLTLLYLKSGGRALLKFLAAEKAKEEYKKKQSDKAANLLFSSLVDIAYTASEQADVRTWRTLPDKIQIARVDLPVGTYRLAVVAEDGRRLAEESVTIRQNQILFKVIPDVN
ncbi:MAG TPA: hypothetical protein VNN76_10480 [Bacteroidota bacterium]|nr:hypothetical protein [Bacteroidota bacterium]